uniref:Genome polyprotein n=1 Tax=Xiangshan flavi-like virus 1 TaxID=2886230 RepID=A0A8K1YQL5_9FLAV|nr:MAG: polyprotein [Xiangshan flavi-like virus 1]
MSSNNENKVRIKRAVRVQAASAQVAAEVKALGEMAQALAKQMDKIKLDQAKVLSVPADQSLPTVNRKRKKKVVKKTGVVAAAAKYVGITIVLAMLLIGSEGVPARGTDGSRICPEAKSGSSNSIIKQLSISTSQDQVKVPAAPNVRATKLYDLKKHQSLLLEAIREIHACRGDVSTLSVVVQDEINLVDNAIGNIEKCVKEHSETINALESQNFHASEAVMITPTYEECVEKLQNMRAIWDKTIKQGHSAHHYSFGRQRKEGKLSPCKDEPNWENWGYLANGRAESCTTGLSVDFDFDVKNCKKDVAVNVNRKSAECTIGHRRFGGFGSGAYAVHAHTGEKSCTFGCFHRSEVYEAFTNQPLCLSCITPFLDILWDVTCIPEAIRNLPIEVESILIYKHKTVFRVSNESHQCHNTWTFDDCCGGRGPIDPTGSHFVDKYCVCRIGTEGEHVLNSIRQYVMICISSATGLLLVASISLAILIVNPALAGFMMFCWFLISMSQVAATCDINNIVTADAVLDRVASFEGHKVTFKIQAGQCIGVAGAMLQIDSIEKRHLYRFEKTIPFKTKLTCANIDWGCWGGSESELAKRNNTCASSCGNGVVYSYQEKVPAFPGSGCAAFWEGVLLRQDLCLSIGEYGSQCRFYRHISYQPIAMLKTTVYVHGSDSVRHMDIVEGEKNAVLNLLMISSHEDIVPATLLKRGAIELCAATTVSLDDKCGSVTLLKPNEIQPECYSPRVEWDPVNSRHKISFTPKDAEALVHNRFQSCPIGSNLTFDGDEAYYRSKAYLATVTLSAKSFDFADAHHWCELANLQVDSKPGVRGFRATTHVEMAKNTVGTCKLGVRLQGCTSLQSNLVVMPTKGVVGLEFYCHGNASDTFVMSTSTTSRSFVIGHVNRNWIPMSTSITNSVVASVLKAEPRKIFGDIASWIGKLKFGNFYAIFATIFNANWIKYLVILLISLVAYNGVLRGNMVNVAISFVAIYIIAFTNYGMSMELNAAVVPAAIVKFTRCNVIWFLNYNLIDQYVFADILDIVMLFLITLALSCLFGALVGTALALMIKGAVQYWDETQRMDSLVPIGRELRYPGVIQLGNFFESNKEFLHHYDYDMYSIDDSRAKFFDWNGLINEVERVKLGETQPDSRIISKTEVSAMIRCEAHSAKGIINVKVPRGYFAYEWLNRKLNIYVCEHVVEVDKRSAKKIYGDVYVNTNRVMSKDPIDCETPKGTIRNGLLEGVLPEDARGLSGFVCIGEDGSFYVVHEAVLEGSSSRLASKRTVGQPHSRDDVWFTCPDCLAVDNSRAGPSVEEIDQASLESLTILDTVREKVAPVMVNPTYGVYTDAWGVRYDKLMVENVSGLRCAEIELWARHVDPASGVRILPDVNTRASSFRPYAASDAYCCIYTDVEGSKEIFKIREKQCFFIIEGSKAYLVIAHTIKSKKKLTSGQILYVWYRGVYPCKENFKAASVVTIARKVNDEYWYPIINDACTIVEIGVRTAQRRGFIEQIPFCKDRQLASSLTIATYFEIKNFGKNKLMRLLNAESELLHSIEVEFSVDYNPFQWDYQFHDLGEGTPSCSDSGEMLNQIEPTESLVVSTHRMVHGVGSVLTSKLDDYDNLAEFIKDVIRTRVLMEDVTRVPVICVTEDYRINLKTQVVVNIRKGDSDIVVYSSGKINVYVTSTGMASFIAECVGKLWRAGFEVFTIMGDLVDIIADFNIAPYAFFHSCEVRETPTLIFATQNEAETRDVMEWLEAELTDRHRSALIPYNNISIHPDWHAGSQALTPKSKHTMTQRSLAEWRLHGSFPIEEIEFRGGDWTRMTAANPCSLLEITNEDYWIGELQSFTSRGSCVGLDTELMTSNHVTRGNSVKIYRNGYDYEWDKPFYRSDDEDVTVYGSKMIPLELAQVGEILCAVSPLRKVAQFLIVTKSSAEFRHRPGAVFYDLRPIKIDDHFTKVSAMPWKGVCGMSGSPIFNSKGKLVSVYGLGKIEKRLIGVPGVAMGEDVRALTVLAPTIRPEIVPDAFFRAAANEAVTSRYDGSDTHFLCVAPTGTGKTIYFTKNLMEICPRGSKVLLLQPAVAAVVNAYNRLSSLLEASSANNNVYTVKYVVGQRNENRTKSQGYGDKTLTLMTYGRALVEVSSIESTYDYILMDEIHNLNDPSVLACDLRLTKIGAHYKNIHLSATVQHTLRGKRLVPHMDISSTRFKIDETVHIMPMMDKSEDGFVNIPSNTIGIKIDGYGKGYKIPREPLEKGRVIFFVSSKRDCEKLSNYLYRTYGGDRQYLPVHSGTTLDMGTLQEDCWLVCTDIVGQSVTIPGCRVVVDFLEEIKPSTQLSINDQGIKYVRSLKRRRIDEFVSKQRKGRTGRTNSGWYIKPYSASPVADNGIDMGSIAEALLKLRTTVGFSSLDIKDYYVPSVLSSVSSLEWVLPEKLVEQRCFHKAVANLGVTRNRNLSMNMGDKLRLLNNINGDMLYLYLSLCLSDELIGKTVASKDLSRTGLETSDSEFYHQLDQYIIRVETEKERRDIHDLIGFKIESERESPMMPPEVCYELFGHIRLSSESDDLGEMDEFVEDSAVGIMMSAASACTALAGVYWWLEFKVSRRVVRAVALSNDQVAPCCKHYARHSNANKAYDAQRETVRGMLAMHWHSAVEWIQGLGASKEKLDSAGMFDLVMSKLDEAFAIIPSSWHLGLVPSLSAVCGAALVGTWYVAIEEVLGATLATGFLICLNATVACLMPIPSAITFVVVEILTFTVSGIINRKSILYDRLGRSLSYPVKAWRLMFGSIAGIGLGKYLINPLLVSKPAILMMGSQSTASLFAHSNLGRTGSAVTLVKQLYVLFVRMLKGESNIKDLAPILTGVEILSTVDLTTVVVGSVLVLSLLVIRKGLEYAKFQVGSVARGVRSTDGRNPYIEDYLGNFDDTALTVLGLGSIFANPTSIISIMVSWIGEGIRNGGLTSAGFRDSFELYAGVPIAITVITEGLKWITAWSTGEVSHSGFIFALPSAIAGLFGCVYYGRKPAVREAIAGAWNYMSGVIMGFIKALGSIIKKVTASSFKWIGRQIGDGIWQHLPTWIRPAASEEGSLELSEYIQVERPEPIIVNRVMYDQWTKNCGLTIIERMYYSLRIAVKERSGSVPPNKFVEYAKSRPGLSFAWSGHSPLPFELAKITTADLNALTRQFTLQTEMSAEVMKMKREGNTIIVEAGYNDLASAVWFEVQGSISSFGILAVGRREGNGTRLLLLGYNVSASLAKGAISNISCTHPLLMDFNNATDVSNLAELKVELDTYLGLSQSGVQLSWPSFGSRVLLGATSLCVSVSRAYFSDIIGMKASRNGTPDQWLAKPANIKMEHWSVVCYYALSLYESGMRTGPFRVPNRDTDLPLQIYAGTSVQWRRLDVPVGSVKPEDCNLELHLEAGKTVSIKRKVSDVASNLDKMLEGVKCFVTMDPNLRFKNQWLHAAYWTGSMVLYIHSGNVYSCTVGGTCSCLIVIDTDRSTLLIRCCKDHDIQAVCVDEGPSWVSYLSGGKESDTDLALAINSLVDKWNSEYKRHITAAVKSKAVPESLSRGFLEQVTDSLTGEEVHHSYGIVQNWMDAFKKLLTRKPGSVSDIMRNAFEELNEASLEVEEDSEDKILFEDALGGRVDWMIGWDTPNLKVRPRFSWLSKFPKYRGTEIRYRDLESISIKNNAIASKMTGRAWESLKEIGRVRLPKRVSDSGLYVSRGGLKMQQLWEADPDFWEDNRVYFDVTCGYGGFAEYTAMKMKRARPRQYLINTLHEKGHRMPDPRITTLESNVMIHRLTNFDHLDRGNIKDTNCRRRLLSAVASFGGADVLIVDAGEFSANLRVNRAFWLDSGPLDSFLDSIVDLKKSVKPGGKMCIKFNGVWDGVYDVLHLLSKDFKEIKFIKLGSTSHGSPEFYMLARGFQPGLQVPAMRAQAILVELIESTYDAYMTMRRILIHQGRGQRSIDRYDWFEPVEKSGVIKVLEDALGRPEPIEIAIGDQKYSWNPNWDHRLASFVKLVKSKSLRWVEQSKSNFKHVTPIGSIGRKKISHPSKNIENGLISDFMGTVFNLGLTNGTFCHTQASNRWREASALKRLDVDPGHMDQGSFVKLSRAMFMTDSKYGLSLKGKCSLLSEEDVLKAINYQGSTGILDDGQTLREYIDIHPDWYEQCLKQITKWSRGEDGGTYFTCRPKNEPKKKKNVEAGKITSRKGDMEELESHNEQGHRFIQFADAKSRLSHYILLGDLIGRANKKKVYKGTINGTPVMRQGVVLRRLWDRHLINGGVITEENQHKFGVRYQGSDEKSEEVSGLCLDYSGWDTSVTLEERLLEAVWLSTFYPDSLKSAIMAACMEMSYPIVTDDDGNCWIRGGQRGSGELLTSIGNTKLVACNTLVAISEAVGVDIAILAETVGEMTYTVKEDNRTGTTETKTIELMKLSQLSDGDDTVIFGPAKMIKCIANGLEEPLNRLRKKIRSGTKSGVKLVDTFDEVEFCSHNYDLTVIGGDVSPLRIGEVGKRMESSPESTFWYLPSRPISDIFSKMRLTLKTGTQKWNPDDELCVEVTRSKVVSYLLLYPHIRVVRHACLSLLTTIGEGRVDPKSLKWRMGVDLDGEFNCKNALNSIYGVEELAEIGYRQYSKDHKELQILRYNVSLTYNRCRVSQKEYLPRMITWAVEKGVVNPHIFDWDNKLKEMWMIGELGDELLTENDDPNVDHQTKRVKTN